MDANRESATANPPGLPDRLDWRVAALLIAVMTSALWVAIAVGIRSFMG